MTTSNKYATGQCSVHSNSLFASRRQNSLPPPSPLGEGVYPVRMLGELGMSESSHLVELGQAASTSLHATGVVESRHQQQQHHQYGRERFSLKRYNTAPVAWQPSSTGCVVDESRLLTSLSTLCPNTPEEEPSCSGSRNSPGEGHDYFSNGTQNNSNDTARAVPTLRKPPNNNSSSTTTNTPYATTTPLSSTETLPLLPTLSDEAAKQDKDDQEETKRAIHCSRHMRDYHCPCATCARFRRTRRQRPRASRGRSQTRRSHGGGGADTVIIIDTWKPASSLPVKRFSLLAAATALRDATTTTPAEMSGAADNDKNTTSGEQTSTETGEAAPVSDKKSRSTASPKLCSPDSSSELFTPISELSSVGMLFEYKERLGRLRIRQQDAILRCEEHHTTQKSRVRQTINVDFGYVKSESMIWEERLKKLEAEEKGALSAADKLDSSNNNEDGEDCHDKETLGTASASPKHNKGVVCPKLKKVTIKAAKAFFRQVLMIKKITELEQDHQLDLARLRRHHLEQDRELLEEYPAINNCLCAGDSPLSKTVRQQKYWKPLLVAIANKKNWEVPQARGVDW